ncbi:MAG TPA: methyltransferase domain-containing protein [Labilithrix sp.]|nr:methyltransferase domain-containing protein [Labilithrix sp.]
MTRASSFPKREIATSPARHLGHEDAAIFETFVVPRYLSFFGERLVSMLAAGRDARVCHLNCRTGYPDRLLLERLPNAHVYGADVSPYAIELARAKAAALAKPGGGVVFEYRVAETLPLAYPSGAFSHAFTIHPLAAPEERRLLLEELARLVAPRGQALIAMPLRGSFIEIADLLRECALKYELPELTNSVEAAIQLRPTDALIERELQAVGFEFVDVDVRTRTLKFAGGRGFFEDPISRLLLTPEFRVNLALETIQARSSVDPFEYVRTAIDKYWSNGTFEMTVSVGVASGRRKS